MFQLNGQFPVRQLSLCVALAMHGLALAQEATQESTALPAVKVEGKSARDAKSYTVEQANTATPLNLSLRDTPQSVTVITQQRIVDQGLQTITDVVNNVTGLSVHQYETNRAQFTARGFDINTLMIDGVPTTWDQSWSSGEVASSLSMYDRVEVVRGSTGLTTGAGDPSAAINLVRKRATSMVLTGPVELGIGSWDKRRAMVDVSTALNQDKSIRARVVGEYSSADSQTDLLTSKSKTLLATFEADLGTNTLLSGGITRQENEPRGSMWGGLPVWYSDGTRTNWDRSKTSSSDWVRWESTYQTYFASLEHSFQNGWKVKASYTRGERDADSYLSYISGAPDRTTGLGMSYYNASYKVDTDQDDAAVQVSGPFQLLGRSHEASLGYTYSKQKFLSRTRAGDSGMTTDFNSWTGSSLAEPSWGTLSHYGSSSTKQEGLYAATRLSLSNPLKLILGARVSDYNKAYEDIYSTPWTQKVNSEVTPYAGLVYDINHNYSAYASYSDIFQPQEERDINGKQLDPILGKSIELGVKGAFMNGRLNASAAVFHIRQDNLAQSTGATIPDTTPPETAYSAAQGATSKGFEFELSGELAPGWSASAGYSQFKAKDADDVDVNTIYPRKTLRLFSTYRLPGAWSDLTVGGGVNWESRTYTVALNPLGADDTIEQKGFALVSLMARYQFTDRVSGQVNVSNLTDKKYFRMFDAYDQMTYGEGRSVSANLRYAF